MVLSFSSSRPAHAAVRGGGDGGALRHEAEGVGLDLGRTVLLPVMQALHHRR